MTVVAKKRREVTLEEKLLKQLLGTRPNLSQDADPRLEEMIFQAMSIAREQDKQIFKLVTGIGNGDESHNPVEVATILGIQQALVMERLDVVYALLKAKLPKILLIKT
jgi:hypothetical protein